MMNWNNGYEKIKSNFKTIAVVLAVFIAGGVYAYQFVTEHPSLPDKAHKLANPPTSKEEDLLEIEENIAEVKKSVGELMTSVNKLHDKVEAKRVDTVRPMKIGINDYELNQWEISVSGKNSLHLEEGDTVLIINNRNEHKQSAHYKVKFISKYNQKDDGIPELYMSTESALYMGVDDPGFKGEFELSVQKIDN